MAHITSKLAVATVIIVLIKFILDGVSLVIFGQSITMGHIDSLTYCSILTPVLAAHGYTVTRPPSNKE